MGTVTEEARRAEGTVGAPGLEEVRLSLEQ